MTERVPVRRRGSDDDVTDDAEPLSVLDLDDPELGIRPEDRFAAIPPGPRLVPRRVHDESTRAPVLLLAGLLALFVLGSWLGGIGSDEAPESRADPAQPVLDQTTDTTLLLVGEEDAAVIDVGRKAAIPVDDAGTRAIARARSIRSRVVASSTAGRAWIVTREPDGTSIAREIDTTSGATTAKVQIDGLVAGATEAGLVVERRSGPVEVVGADGATTTTLAPSGRVMGAARNLVTVRPECAGRACGVAVIDVTTGTSRELPGELAASGTELGSLSPDGRKLAIVRSDGVDTHGVLVDVELGTVTPFRARGLRRAALGPAALAWSPDEAWLFVATAPNGLDAVATGDGTAYRVDAELPPVSAILVR